MNIDLIAMLGNLSQSLYPLQRFITGGAYILGILFFITAISKLKTIGGGRSQEKIFAPMVYLMFGAALLYLPTAMSTLANTAFGVGNILTYSNYNQGNINSVIGLFIRTAGLLWFVRGSVLVAQASQPGTQEGPKGLVFLLAGILAMNFDNTIAMLNSLINYIINWGLSVKTSHGY
jgi:hypothetical protein